MAYTRKITDIFSSVPKITNRFSSSNPGKPSKPQGQLYRKFTPPPPPSYDALIRQTNEILHHRIVPSKSYLNFAPISVKERESKLSIVGLLRAMIF